MWRPRLRTAGGRAGRSPSAAAATACRAIASATAASSSICGGWAPFTVDPVARRALVGGGALLGDVDRATQAHGLVVPAGVVSHTGVGGLTLGGGVGRLMRRFGLTIDSLLAAELVSAEGEFLRASAEENPDLFWALRGGGGNFGVVTEFTFALHELRELLILATFHGADDAPRVLAQAAATMSAGAPDALLWTSFLRKAPPLPWVPAGYVGRPGLMSLIEWSGAPDEGRERLAAIADELAPSGSSLDTVPFLEIQTLTDEIFAAGKRTYIKAGFARRADSGADRGRVRPGRAGRARSSPRSKCCRWAGRSPGSPVDATAFPHRDAAWLLNIPATWAGLPRRRARDRLGTGELSRHLPPPRPGQVRQLHGRRRGGGRGCVRATRWRACGWSSGATTRKTCSRSIRTLRRELWTKQQTVCNNVCAYGDPASHRLGRAGPTPRCVPACSGPRSTRRS